MSHIAEIRRRISAESKNRIQEIEQTPFSITFPANSRRPGRGAGTLIVIAYESHRRSVADPARVQGSLNPGGISYEHLLSNPISLPAPARTCLGESPLRPACEERSWPTKMPTKRRYPQRTETGLLRHELQVLNRFADPLLPVASQLAGTNQLFRITHSLFDATMS